MTNKFPTSASVEDLCSLKPVPDPPKSGMKRFWCLWVPLGAVAGFFACIIENSGGMFLPVWGVVSFVLWAIDAGRNDGQR